MARDLLVPSHSEPAVTCKKSSDTTAELTLLAWLITGWRNGMYSLRINGPLWGNPPVTGGSPHKGLVVRTFFGISRGLL